MATALFGLIGVGITAYLGYLGNRAQIETPIVATQTAEASKFTQTVSASTQQLPQSYDVGDEIKQNCIDSSHWEPYAYLSTPDTISGEIPAPIPAMFKLGCMEEDAQNAYGFHSKNGSLVIQKQQEQDSTIYGISTPLPEKALVQLDLLINKSSSGEIIFGILSKARANPLSAMETFVSASPYGKIQLVTTGLGTLDSYPFVTDKVYQLKIEVTPNTLQININNGEKIFETSGDFASYYFTVGYRLEKGESIDATISNLSIRRK